MRDLTFLLTTAVVVEVERGTDALADWTCSGRTDGREFLSA
jgi:hypothetical protein